MRFYHQLIASAGGAKCAAAIAMAVSATALTSCIDDNYDLSDIDTTVRVSVNDLTLPINMDEVLLKNIIDIKDDGIVQEINGEYAILRNGSFASSELKVDPISIDAPEVDDAVTTFRPAAPAAAVGDVTYEISQSDPSTIHYSYNGVSDAIVSIDRLTMSWTIVYDVDIAAIGATVDRYIIDNVSFRLPKGLTGTPSMGFYDEQTGLINIAYAEVTNGKLQFSMNVTAIDANLAGVKYDAQKHTLDIEEESGIAGGQIYIAASDMPSGAPQEIRLTTSLTLSRIDITAFSGALKYDVDDFDIAPVELNDLPDVLSQPGTDIKLSNPQIYLNINNPFTAYGLHATTGFALDAIREGHAPVHTSIDDATFTISSAAQSAYCLSPALPGSYYPGYEAATYVPYASLPSAFSGNGLPGKIEIDLDPTTVPTQSVTDFALGTYPAVDGEYLFYAPLALGKGSTIEYTDTEDGWSDETLEKMTITTLKVDASVSTNLPFDIEITGYPVDKNGNQIKNVEIKGAQVKANSQAQPLTIYITGTITDLDGIRFSAHAVNEAEGQPLTPSQHISLQEIRATVTGYYDDEL